MADAPTPSAWIDSWTPDIDLTSPAGQMLRRMVALASPGSLITLFGSAPLQLSLDRDFDGRQVRIPHPIDILIGKFSRMDAKDLKAFQMVRERTGHPTEEELITELQNAVDLYLPSFDESQGRDMKTTTRMLWRDFFDKDIDVAAKIIGPAQQRRRASYSRDHSQTDHRSGLKGL